jgi:hypothetical protein
VRAVLPHTAHRHRSPAGIRRRGPRSTRSRAPRCGRACHGGHANAVPVLLSTAVEHALESMNPVRALGAADGSSRYGTHQGPSAPSRASMKRGSFPMRPAFPTSEYCDPLRLPLDRHLHFPGSPVIGGASLPATPQMAGPRRLSRVPRTTFHTFNAQYAGGFFSARSWTKSAFRGLRRARTGSAPSIPTPQGRGSLTTLTRASLALQTARLIPPRFAPGLSTTHGGITTRDPGVSPDRTHTGRPP